jgi:hypothetical protein
VLGGMYHSRPSLKFLALIFFCIAMVMLGLFGLPSHSVLLLPGGM